MSLFARKKIALFKLEVTPGVDPVPVGSDAIETSNFSIVPLDGPTVSRNLDRATLGNDQQIQVGTFVTCSFEIQLAGSGDAATPPQWSEVLQACGFQETVNAGTSVQYDPISASFPTATIYAHLDGQLHRMTYCRGSVAFDLSPGTIPKMTFTFTGLYNTPTSTADPTPDLTGWQVPLPGNNTNTTTFALHGESPTMEQCTIDMANQVVYRNVVGDESVQITDRAPTGAVVFEKEAISVKDWYTTAKDSVLGALQVVHGTAAGNIVTVDAPRVQVSQPRDGDSDGIATLNMNLSLIPTDTGDDEIRITTS